MANWTYLYLIIQVRKYTFALVVGFYLLSSVGIPVYLHYCGGELEKVNYVTKGKSCCGDKENTNKETNSCCKDESLFLRCAGDFTFKAPSSDFTKTISQWFYLPGLPPITIDLNHQDGRLLLTRTPSPPGLHNSRFISTIVLRI